jgi:hypothetical protein
MISRNAHDISGTNNKNGTATYRGLIIFNDGNSTGKLAFLNNLKGIYVTESNGNTDNNKNVEIEMISNSCYELQLLMVLAHTRYIIVIGPIGNTTDRMLISDYTTVV